MPSRRADFDDLYDATDDETEFSDSVQSMPSSRPTSFATDSTRFSQASNASRNKYPSLVIPTTSWPLQDGSMKSPIPPTPPAKIPVSPAMLSLLPQQILAVNATPSLDGSLSSDQISNLSTPQTPETRSIAEGESWGHRPSLRVRQDPISHEFDFDPSPGGSDVAIEIHSPEHRGAWDNILEDFPQAPQFSHQPLPTIVEASREASRETSPDSKAKASPSRSNSGIELPEDALATLQSLGLDPASDLQSESNSIADNHEMEELGAPVEVPKVEELATPASELSKYSFTDLSIPSPGGFFSSLRAGTRHTWCFNRENVAPPTSTTAENFYNVPWRDGGNIVERVVEVEEALTDGPPTARLPQDVPILKHPKRPRQQSFAASVVSIEEIRKQSSPVEYDETYAEEMQSSAAANFDRTSVWLAAQASYLSALRESNPVNELPKTPDEENPIERQPSVHVKRPSTDSTQQKSVRFAEEPLVSTTPPPEPEADEKKSSVHYRGFQAIQKRTRRRDSFTHSIPRFDAIQAQRIGLMDKHIDHLLGKFDLAAPVRPAYTGPFSRMSRQLDKTEEQKMYARIEEEQRILKQLSVSVWVVEALKFLYGGRLLPSPAGDKFARVSIPLDQPENAGTNRHRILDLGGQPSCDWAWHCANAYRNVKTYTVITKQQVVNDDLQGPANHRRVSVPQLWKLPFPDNHFDLISARSLFMHLQNVQPVGETADEYDLCLHECLRILKPGGYLEFLVLDSEIVQAGPLGSAVSVEFNFNLKTRGYDPTPTKAFLGRLRKAHFTNMKRAWMYLPLGSAVRPDTYTTPREAPSPTHPTSALGSEAVLGPVGSTDDVASISGLLGGWLWEQWMLKLHMEMGKEKEKLLEGVSGAIEEGRGTGAGWRCLSGWARKPKPKQTQKVRRARISEV